MCGLVGIIDRFVDTKQLEMFRWMLHFDVLRGEDSTGVAIRHSPSVSGKPGQVEIYKALGHPDRLHQKFPEVFEPKGLIRRPQDPIRFVMGHNRAKTIGSASHSNAHPFHCEHIVGCHNGTLKSGLHTLPKNVEGQTDSEQVFLALAQGQSIDEIVNNVSGAFALTWWNAKSKTFNIFRNSQRPLWLAWNRQKTTLAYASEKWMLEVAIAKTNQSSSLVDIEKFEEDRFLSFEIDPAIKVVEDRQVKKAAVIRHTYAEYGRSNYRGPKPSTGTSTVVDTGWYRPPAMTENQFNNLTAGGCALCQSHLDFRDNKEKVNWLDRETPLCVSCAISFKEGDTTHGS
jgi:glucosamine 6-phosphate synthetase-like amidotransferase/phosphosugar isomerase protein